MSSRYVILVLIMAMALLLQVSGACAYNVPGSTGLILPSVVRETGFAVIEANEEATIASVEQLHRQEQNSAVPPLGYVPGFQPPDPARFALAYGPEDNTPIPNEKRFAFGFNIRGRHVEDAGDELPFDYDLVVGAAALSYRASPNLYLTITGIVDGGSGETDFNNGAIRHIAGGGSATMSWYAADSFRFMTSAGYSRVEYNLERSNGAIDGSFSADRVFIDSNGSWVVDDGAGWMVKATGGLRYLHQWNDAYVETGVGGGAVGDSEIAFLRAYSDVKLGYNFGVITPFARSRLGYDFDIEDTAPTAALQVFESDLDTFTAAFGGGIQADARQADFVLEGDVRLTGDEFSGYSGSARLALPF